MKHSPKLHHHIKKLKGHLDNLTNNHVITDEHIDTLKKHVDSLHHHVGLLKGPDGHQHVENLKTIAKALIEAHLGGGEGSPSKNENGGNDENSEEEAEELVKNFRNKSETMGGLNAEQMLGLFKANHAEHPDLASREERKKLQDLMSQLKEAEEKVKNQEKNQKGRNLIQGKKEMDLTQMKSLVVNNYQGNLKKIIQDKTLLNSFIKDVTSKISEHQNKGSLTSKMLENA